MQRVPVRIRLDPQEVRAHPLRIGLSADVRVDVADRSGPLIASDVRGGVRAPSLDFPDDPAVEARVREIIAGHSRFPAGTGTRPGP